MDRESEMLQLSYQTKSIQFINTLLAENNHEPPSDALLISILILAAHGQRQGGGLALEPVHPTSPLAQAQNLMFYGSLEFVPNHLKALYYLVEQKGGLEKIQLYGLADTLAL